MGKQGSDGEEIERHATGDMETEDKKSKERNELGMTVCMLAFPEVTAAWRLL